MLIAVAHVIGAMIALLAFGFMVVALGVWEQERNRKAALQELSLALGIPTDELDDVAHTSKVIRFSANRFSTELFRNRLSDLCGLVSTAWGWLGIAAQIVALGGVILYSFSDSSVAANAWWVVAIAAFFWITSVVFALTCKLLTGRYPGQARETRKFLAQFVESQKSVVKVNSQDESTA